VLGFFEAVLGPLDVRVPFVLNDVQRLFIFVTDFARERYFQIVASVWNVVALAGDDLHRLSMNPKLCTIIVLPSTILHDNFTVMKIVRRTGRALQATFCVKCSVPAILWKGRSQFCRCCKGGVGLHFLFLLETLASPSKSTPSRPRPCYSMPGAL
jgi:hypothetical protein